MGTAAPPAGDVATFRFSTDDFSERERLTAWREIFGRTVCKLDIEPLAADRFRSDSTIYARPGLGVLAGSLGRAFEKRDAGVVWQMRNILKSSPLAMGHRRIYSSENLDMTIWMANESPRSVIAVTSRMRWRS